MSGYEGSQILACCGGCGGCGAVGGCGGCGRLWGLWEAVGAVSLLSGSLTIHCRRFIDSLLQLVLQNVFGLTN